MKAKQLIIKSVKKRMKVNDSIAKEEKTETFFGIPDDELIPFGRWLAQTILMYHPTNLLGQRILYLEKISNRKRRKQYSSSMRKGFGVCPYEYHVHLLQVTLQYNNQELKDIPLEKEAGQTSMRKVSTTECWRKCKCLIR